MTKKQYYKYDKVLPSKNKNVASLKEQILERVVEAVSTCTSFPIENREVLNLSTNYYMMTTNKDLVNKYFPSEYEIVDSPYLGYEIHIGKRSCGWKPLFQEHKNAYSSVSEMILFLKGQSDIRIFDEYNREFDINGLVEELIDWGNQEKKIIHYDDYIGDIQSPIDHVEIASRDHRYSACSLKYWHDEDGYDFTDRWFS